MRCLVVEDDPILRDMICDMLEEMGHDADQAGTRKDAEKALATRKYDLVHLDYHLPDGTALELSDYAACLCPNTRIILVTGSDIFPHGEHTKFAPGVDWVMRKPVSILDLEALVAYAEQDARCRPLQLTALP